MKIKHIILVSVLIVLNGFLNLRVPNLAVCLPEIAIVLYLLFKKKTGKALFYHTLFFITSSSNIFTEEFLLDNNVTSNLSYNYANLGFHGLRLSLIISFLIVMVQNGCRKISITARKSVFYKLFRFLQYCVATGFVLGVLGLFLLGYSLSNFLLYGYYSLFCFCFALSYLYEYDTHIKDDLYELVPYIISIAVVFNFLCSILGFNKSLIVIGSSSIGAYCFVLIPLLLFQKKSIPILIAIGLQLYLMSIHSSGKGLYSLIFMFIAALVLSFSKGSRGNIGLRHLTKVRLFLILVIVCYPFIQQTMSTSSEDQEGNLEWKMKSVETLSEFFVGQRDMNAVSDSPYIRLAEISNIIYEDVRNPIFLFFGRGFGGYYQDNLHLFSGYDLANGAFSREEIRTGKFSYGHDTFVTVPMLNGFIGFFMLVSLIVTMCKKSTQNYLYLTSLMFLLLWFYFDVLMGVIGVMLLYAAEHRLQKT